MDLNALDILYQRFHRGQIKDDFTISLLIEAQKVRIEQLEEELMTHKVRAVSMYGVIAGDITISGITVGK